MPMPRMMRKTISHQISGEKRRGDRAGGEHEHLVAVDALAAQHVGDPAEQDRAERRSEQRGRSDEAPAIGEGCHSSFRIAITTPMMNRS